MANSTGPLRFLNSTAVRVLSIVLLAQGILLYAFSRNEYVPKTAPLSTFPQQVGPWRMIQEGVVDPETLAVLKADDTLTRTYARALDRMPTNLFIAAFTSQKTGKAPHSPKNCLPGSGWTQTDAAIVNIEVPGGVLEANRYVVAKGGSSSVVLYWYQSRERSIASEYKAKVYVVLDSLRYNRSDTALVRVVAPVVGGDDASAIQSATDFVKDVYPAIRAALPN